MALSLSYDSTDVTVVNFPRVWISKVSNLDAHMFGNVDGTEPGHVRRYFVDGEPDVVKLSPALLFAVA